MGKAALTLWGHPASSTTNRIRIALAIKKIPYVFKVIDLMADQQKSDEWVETKNMLQQIPVLQVGDEEDNDNNNGGSPILLRQSIAILEYLEEAYPESLPRLLPEDPIARARVREIAEIVNSFIQPMQNKLTVEKVAEMDPELAEWLPKAFRAHLDGDKHVGEGELNYWPHWWMRRGFTAIEGLIADDAIYCCGDSLTLADCALIPQVIGGR
jgi:maleylacetoacetate isomerase